ncbi:MAG: hypothetical protein K2K70_10110 [Lachnospiraceae bacterium]|nr:hypothetical protein [Lachnospiraceae bacterium]
MTPRIVQMLSFQTICWFSAGKFPNNFSAREQLMRHPSESSADRFFPKGRRQWEGP